MPKPKFVVSSVFACLVATGTLAAPAPESKGAIAAEPASSGGGQVLPTAPVASIDGRPVLESEIEDVIGPLVRQAEAEYLNKTYELRRGALDQLIMNRLVEAEAKKAGKTNAQWMEEVLFPKVSEPTEGELRKLYEESKAELAGATFEQSKERLRGEQRRLAGQKRLTSAVQDLMAKHAVKILLVPPEPLRFAVEAAGPSRGADKAKVTIVEFSDFQCPFCGRAGSTLSRVLKEYEGRVRVVYRQFPLSFHPFAEKAAEASLCAAEQGKFWEIHDRMFADQSKLGVVDLKATAKEIGIDSAKFDACLDGGSKSAAVYSDIKAGQKVGVQGTPAFFVNGVFINGAAPYEQFKTAIDRELEKG